MQRYLLQGDHMHRPPNCVLLDMCIIWRPSSHTTPRFMGWVSVKEKIARLTIDLGWIHGWEVTITIHSPVLDTIAACELEIIKQVSDSMIMILTRAKTILCTSNNCVSDVSVRSD